MDENAALKLEDKIKKALSIVTDDFGRADVSFLLDMEYPFIIEIKEIGETLNQDDQNIYKIEIDDIDMLEKEFKALPENCEVKIVGLVSTMILQSRVNE